MSFYFQHFTTNAVVTA